MDNNLTIDPSDIMNTMTVDDLESTLLNNKDSFTEEEYNDGLLMVKALRERQGGGSPVSKKAL